MEDRTMITIKQRQEILERLHSQWYITSYYDLLGGDNVEERKKNRADYLRCFEGFAGMREIARIAGITSEDIEEVKKSAREHAIETLASEYTGK
jgi:hypothetical protein